jgi:penicillin-binding protein 1C
MANPDNPGDNQDLAHRFRRIVDTNEAEDAVNPTAGETAAGQTPPSETQSEEQSDETVASTQPEILSEQPETPVTQPIETPAEPSSERLSPDQTVSEPIDATVLEAISPLTSRAKTQQTVLPIDEYGMPLPGHINRHINQPGVAIPASTNTMQSQPIKSQSASTEKDKPQTGARKSTGIPPIMKSKRPHRTITMQQGAGCIFRMMILAMLGGIVLVLVGGSLIVYEYYKIAATLPSVADLEQRASTFETTRIYDRNGDLLYEILDPNAGRRTFTTLDKISPYLVAATIATEDKSFYSHPGFDWTAIVRAFWQNFQGKGTVSGASTITQQLARYLFLSPEERTEQSYLRKVREALLAAEITRRYTKDQILELYLNEFYYGNMAYGIEAASETYFNTTADKLDLAQASFLAGLPQAPAVYDVYHNREATRNRQKQVLTLMYEDSNEEKCIFVSNSPERICVNADEAVAAYTALENYQFNPPYVQIRYPHWVNYVRSILETQFDAQTIYRSGFSVYTTLDPSLQEMAEEQVKQQVDSLAEYNANDGALVAIKPSTGEILAMVGSADFYNDAIDGQVNMATSATRQPGSSIKPVTYIASFEKGWTPATLIWDVPSEFPPSGDPTDPRPPYKPVNYDGRFHGPVTVRTALANSYNIPAVKTLQFDGIYDDPNTPNEDGMLAVARKLGITSLTRDDYGLSLTLGGGEVSLLEMTGVYAVIANGGNRVPPFAILKILDHTGNVVFDYQPPAGDQVVRPEHAYLITSILSDNEARTPMFGANSVLNLPFPAAAKTGTSNDYRDNWTLGYTPDLAVGVWVGNADYTPMNDVSGLTGAAPIWSQFMQSAVPQLTGSNPTPFSRPSGIVERVICEVSGTEPSQWCPDQRVEVFASDQLPQPSSQDLWSKVVFDTWTGLRASEACKDFTKEEFALNVTDSWAVGWIQNNPEGKDWASSMGFSDPIRYAPPRECQSSDPQPIVEFSSLSEGQMVSVSPLDIMAKIDVAADFQNFTLDYGTGDNPIEWNRLMESSQPASQPSKIYSWDLKDVPQGLITLRLTINSIRGGSAERKIHLNLSVPTATPTMTPSATPTSTPTSTFTPPPLPTITPFPSPTQMSTPTTAPTEILPTGEPTGTPSPPPGF